VIQGFIFTTAMPPTVLASNIASIRILKGPEGRQLREQHWEAVNALRDELDDFGIEYKKPARASHITAVELGSTWLADQVMDELDRRGFYVQGRIKWIPLFF
jgi:5-aminolevulinate synthase